MITESLDGASQLLKANSESASTMVAGRGFHWRMVFKNRTLWDGHLSSVALLFGWIGGHPYWCMLLIWKSSNYLQITKQLFEGPKHWVSHWYNIITKVTLVQCPGVYLSRPCLSATGSRQSILMVRKYCIQERSSSLCILRSSSFQSRHWWGMVTKALRKSNTVIFT